MSGSVVDMTDLTTDQYRDAVSNFPTGLVVVTAKVAGELLGFTCQTQFLSWCGFLHDSHVMLNLSTLARH